MKLKIKLKVKDKQERAMKMEESVEMLIIKKPTDNVQINTAGN